MKNLLRVLALLVALTTACGARAGALGYVGVKMLGDKVAIDWDSFASTGAFSATTGLATSDLSVYKQCGATSFNLTKRASNAGMTLIDTDGEDIDGHTGFNGVQIDTADNTTAGFWESGCDIFVNLDSVTIDSQSVHMTARFSLDPNVLSFGTLSADSASTATAKVGTTGLTSDDQYKYSYIWNRTTGEKRCITTTDDNTVDVITFSPNSAVIWHMSDVYKILLGDGPCSPITQPTVSGAGGVYLAGVISPGTADFNATSGANLTDYFNNGGASAGGYKLGDTQTSLAGIKAETDLIGTPPDLGLGATIAANQLVTSGTQAYGTCGTSSTTTACRLASLTQADNYWNNWSMIYVVGVGSRCVRGFSATNQELQWPQALPSTSLSQKFVLLAAPECRTPP